MKPNAFRLCRQVERLELLTLISTLELLSTLRDLPISGYHIKETLLRESFQRTGGRISHAALLTEGRPIQVDVNLDPLSVSAISLPIREPFYNLLLAFL